MRKSVLLFRGYFTSKASSRFVGLLGKVAAVHSASVFFGATSRLADRSSATVGVNSVTRAGFGRSAELRNL
jgi:hypothetical protein